MLSPASGVFGGAEKRRCSTCSTHLLDGGRLENRVAYTWSLKRSHLVLANRVLGQEQLELKKISYRDCERLHNILDTCSSSTVTSLVKAGLRGKAGRK